jgi:hypothetical protein
LIKIFDETGKKIEERKLNSKDENDKVMIKTYSDSGFLTLLTFMTKNGNDIKLKIKNEEGNGNMIFYDEKKERLIIFSSKIVNEGKSSEDIMALLKTKLDEDEYEDFDDEQSIVVVEPEPNSTSVAIYHRGKKALTSLPITINNKTGQIILNENKELLILPDVVLNDAEDNYHLDKTKNVVIKDLGGKLIYEIEGEKVEKIVGIFQIRMPLSMYYDTSTKKFTISSMSFLNKLKDLISF